MPSVPGNGGTGAVVGVAVRPLLQQPQELLLLVVMVRKPSRVASQDAVSKVQRLDSGQPAAGSWYNSETRG